MKFTGSQSFENVALFATSADLDGHFVLFVMIVAGLFLETQ